MLAIYTVTLFLSALLMFLIQPMVGKMILPSLGGTPAVWNTCMVFFQAALLAGYAYAHGTVAWLGVRRQAVLQMVLLLLPLAVLPIMVDASAVPASSDNPVFWLLGCLLLGVGLPFLVISTNAPLLQRWFSQTGHREAHDPYFLYGASNTGSLLALLGYPVLVEPFLDVQAQSWIWAGGYVLFVALAVVCAVVLWRSPRPAAEAVVPEEAEPSLGRVTPERTTLGGAMTWARRLRWVALAFVPSSLMLGVTTHITTDIAPVPLLWVIPLALYLASFILVFARRPLLPHATMMKVFPFVVAPVILMTMQQEAPLGWLPVPAHLLLLFVVAMVCHGELAADRPASKHLTEFYLWMSIGGVLGGAFNALVAPVLFNTLVEYPLVVILACFVLARRSSIPHTVAGWVLDLLIGLGIGVVVAGFLLLLRFVLELPSPPLGATILVPAGLCVVAAGLSRDRMRFGFGLSAALLAVVFCTKIDREKLLYEGRNFYGIKSVSTDAQDRIHTFLYGSTIHGAQFTGTQGRHIPLTYFHPTGPVGDVFSTYHTREQNPQVAIIGLGVGAMASYAKPGETFTFYEIDPEVERVASDPALFTFLQDCAGTVRVVLGDGRLSLARAKDGTYGLMFLDAFSSDAVPTHLLTREALALYLRKLDDRGVLAFNVTNRYLDLAPLLANLAADAGLVCYYRYDPANEPEKTAFPGKNASKFVVMARQERDIRRLIRHPDWKETPRRPRLRVWTDQFTNIFSLLDWR